MPIIYNKYDPHAKKKGHATKNPYKFVKGRIKSRFEDGKLKPFGAIEIETMNRCNLSCPFCPAGSKNDDKREFSKMSEELFKKIIGDLKTMRFKGKVALYANNEPFLDDRIFFFLEYAKKQLPSAHHRIYTNGTLLTLEKFITAMEYLDSIVIDNYNDDLTLIPPVKEIYDYCIKTRVYEHRIRICLRKVNEVLTTRGGLSPNGGKKEAPDFGCLLPFYQIVVRPDGMVSLCCSDVYGYYNMGDLNQETPLEVWFGSAFEDMRKVLKYQRKVGVLCPVCDMVK